MFHCFIVLRKHISEMNGFIYFITYTYIIAQKKLNIFLLP